MTMRKWRTGCLFKLFPDRGNTIQRIIAWQYPWRGKNSNFSCALVQRILCVWLF